ncbi:endopeptidase La, partial [bacterium]
MVKGIPVDEKKRGNPTRFPLLPLRDMVVFPHMVVPLFVGREKSVLALEAAMASNRFIFLATQKNARKDDPLEDDIHLQGTLCKVIQLLHLPDRTVKVLVEGKRRGIISRFISDTAFFSVVVDEVGERCRLTAELEALTRSVKATFETYATLTKKIPQETVGSVADIEQPSVLSDT